MALSAPSPLSVADVLDRAADLIEPEGKWYPAGRGDKLFCAWTAINEIGGWDSPAATAFAKRIGGKRPRDIWAWNDAPGRTQSEVVATLRAAAAKERAEPQPEPS